MKSTKRNNIFSSLFFSLSLAISPYTFLLPFTDLFNIIIVHKKTQLFEYTPHLHTDPFYHDLDTSPLKWSSKRCGLRWIVVFFFVSSSRFLIATRLNLKETLSRRKKMKVKYILIQSWCLKRTMFDKPICFEANCCHRCRCCYMTRLHTIVRQSAYYAKLTEIYCNVDGKKETTLGDMMRIDL